jgi:lipoprotein-anchoring transpeptidase ErfK/SrfK
VKITRSAYRIVIRRGSTNLTLYKDGYPQATFPVGLGTPKTPTPLGSFYLGVIERDTSPGYGPFQLDTTAHSEAIQSWQGSGDAVIAIHGPISGKSDKQIGSAGTYISNGCVRMHTADLQRLAVVPMGTPIDIVQ